MKRPVTPEISEYMSQLARRRKNPYYGFKDRELAKKAGDKGRETQKANREANPTKRKNRT